MEQAAFFDGHGVAGLYRKSLELGHDSETWVPAFGKNHSPPIKNHSPPINENGMPARRKVIPLYN
jgi:hypothetical protein